MTQPDPSLPWPVPAAAVALIAEAEGLRLRAYLCPAGVWTIGYGRTRGVVPGMTCTVEEADRWLCDELRERAAAVRALLTRHAEPNQLGAMLSLHYNIGAAGFSKSSVLQCHNRGDFAGAARAFGLWNKARVGGELKALPGLTARRAAEAALYLRPEPEERPPLMPQVVEPESSLVASPIAQSGTVAAGVGVVGLANEIGGQLAPVKAALSTVRDLLVDTLGVPAHVLPWVLVAIVGGVVVWQRRKQRRGGWA